MLCGVLAYIQQVKVSVSYVYSVRDKVDMLLKKVDIVLGEISQIEQGKDIWHKKNEKVEESISELVNCAQDATRAIPYLNDNRGNLYRISDSLTVIKTENMAYRALWAEKMKTNVTYKERAVEADEVTGVIDALLTEIKSQIQAADWVFTKIDGLVQNTNLSINRTDQRRNMEIADSSYTISVESKRDNLSMMTIAAITMVFLPGTFVASFFAMPVLDWEPVKGHHVVNSRFWIYWVVTVPLTIATILFWWVWFSYRRPKEPSSTGQTMPNSQNAVTMSNRPAQKPTVTVASGFQTPLRTATEMLRLKRHQRTDWSNA